MKNKNLSLLFSLISFLVALDGYSQLGIPLISQRNKCKAFKDIQSEESIRIEDALNKGGWKNSYVGSSESLKEILNDTENPLSTAGKLYVIDKIIDVYVCEIQEDDSCIYNLARADFGELYYDNNAYVEYSPTEIETYEKRLSMAEKGFQIVNNYFEYAISIADEESQEYFRKKRLYYTVQSDLLDDQFDYHFSVNNSNYNYWELDDLSDLAEKGKSKNIDINVFKIADEDYKSTGFCPYPEFMGLNVGFSSFYGKDLWLGGEISSDYVQFANPFKLYDPISSSIAFRVSTFGVGYHKNIETYDNDISLNSLRITSIFLFNLSPTQFGFKWGPSFTDDKKYWYYRPEIGLTCGIFTISYGYNLMFNKSVRALTDKSVINFKISYPLIKLSR